MIEAWDCVRWDRRGLTAWRLRPVIAMMSGMLDLRIISGLFALGAILQFADGHLAMAMVLVVLSVAIFVLDRRRARQFAARRRSKRRDRAKWSTPA